MADIDRPLNDRGKADVLRVAAYLKDNNLMPDMMLVSVAERTRETANLLLNSFSLAEENIIFDRQLYLADSQTLRETIEIYAKPNSRLLILAHNPGMDDLVSYLASTAPALSSSGKLMTTCAAACFSFDSLDKINRRAQCDLKVLIRAKEITIP